MGITRETLSTTFNANGFASPLSILSYEEALGYRLKLEAYEAARGQVDPKTQSRKTHLLLKWMFDLVNHKNILDDVEDILGENILCWGTSFFIKEPWDGTFVSWHQDITYWGLEPDDVLTAWLALSPVTKDSGCMRMLPGSHKKPRLEHHETSGTANLLTRGQEISSSINEDKAFFIELQPGEISLHHGGTAHASAPNMTNDRRIGIAIRYISPNVKSLAGDESAILLRGHDDYGHFHLEAAPENNMDAAAIAEHERANTLRQAILTHLS